MDQLDLCWKKPCNVESTCDFLKKTMTKVTMRAFDLALLCHMKTVSAPQPILHIQMCDQHESLGGNHISYHFIGRTLGPMDGSLNQE